MILYPINKSSTYIKYLGDFRIDFHSKSTLGQYDPKDHKCVICLRREAGLKRKQEFIETYSEHSKILVSIEMNHLTNLRKSTTENYLDSAILFKNLLESLYIQKSDTR